MEDWTGFGRRWVAGGQTPTGPEARKNDVLFYFLVGPCRPTPGRVILNEEGKFHPWETFPLLHLGGATSGNQEPFSRKKTLGVFQPQIDQRQKRALLYVTVLERYRFDPGKSQTRPHGRKTPGRPNGWKTGMEDSPKKALFIRLPAGRRAPPVETPEGRSPFFTFTTSVYYPEETLFRESTR